jgi:hypothetical protein
MADGNAGKAVKCGVLQFWWERSTPPIRQSAKTSRLAILHDLKENLSMKKCLAALLLCLLAASARANVRLYVQDTNGMASINYECTAGEVVRAFALDVRVDQGRIIGVSNYFRGPSTAVARGYGIFPSSFRDNITVSSGTNANWSTNGYSPLAVVADNPAGTQPGLNSSGVTLEFGALWDPAVLAAIPPPRGTLCSLQLSQTANVTVGANLSRGGIISSPPDIPITPQFNGALVGPAITSATLANGLMTILFQGGELESAPAVTGPWTGTGNRTGRYTEALGTSPSSFHRVHNH